MNHLLSRDLFPNPVDVKAPTQDLNFESARRIAHEKARSSDPEAMLLAWFDRTTGRFSPQVTCCGEEKPAWLIYAESRGANLSVIVNGGQYIFVYSTGGAATTKEPPDSGHTKEPAEDREVQREEYLRKTGQRFEDLSRGIDELEERLKGGDNHTLMALQAKLEDLRKKQHASLTRLEEVRSASPQAWKHMKAGADMALVILAEFYEKIVSSVK